MMPLKVELSSKDTIKPSSPTPHHLKTYNFSLIDQYTPPVSVPILLFYSAAEYEPHRRLQKSLSEALTLFYPLAGRTDERNRFIDCNDEGVNFFQARVYNTQLSQIITHPIAEELYQLLPTDNFYGLGPKVLLSIQVSIFDCGGMAIGVCISHKAADASSLSLFLNIWAAISRGGNENQTPKFEGTSLFPPKEEGVSVAPLVAPNGSKNIVSKRFVFNASNIEALKAKSSNSMYVKHPTRVEVVSALIWKCANNTRAESSVVQITANLRGRMDPPLPNSHVGNLVAAVFATSSGNRELDYLVGQVHEAIDKIDGDYVKRLQREDGVDAVYNTLAEMSRGEVDVYMITSWCRFPFYEVDFGWGEPVWVSTVNFGFPNLVMLMDTKCGEGVEAWVALSEEEMDRFECEPELIA